MAIEWRGKVDDPKWRGWADFGIAVGSWLPAILWGTAFAILVRGLPVDADGQVNLSIGDVLNPYTLLGGLATAALFLFYGAVFVALKTAGDIRDDAHRFARWLVAAGHGTGCGLWGLDPIGVRQGLDLGGAGRGGGRAAGGGAAGLAARLRRVGVRLHPAGGGERGGAVVRLAVPQPGALDAEQPMERHDLQRLVDPLHAEDHDVGRRDHDAVDGDLSGLDVLGFPATDLG